MSDPVSAELVTRRLGELRARIEAAGGDPGATRIVAVTKGFGADAARAAVDAGVDDLGENYAQELGAKARELEAGELHPRWHFIGRLQRNKVRKIAAYVSLWQSVDRPALAHEIAKRSPGAAVFMQINTTGEEDKGGCRPEEAPALAATIRSAALDLTGVMAVGPTSGDAGVSAREAFEAAARTADELGLVERSFGMTGDLEAAVAAGTTMVRVGTGLFGPRLGTPKMGH